MPHDVGVFPDAELLLVAGLAPRMQARWPALRLVTILPATIAGPVVRIKRTSGAARDIVLDRPVLDADTFASDYGECSLISRTLASALLSLRGLPLVNGVITNVNIIQGSRWLPDPSPDLYRFSATYEVFMHGTGQ
ncbi:MAG: hypothetical protein FWE15_02130 [Actinomycetia bacterium]|nr:hypothetical protein [Actinomycetes bacterium]